MPTSASCSSAKKPPKRQRRSRQRRSRQRSEPRAREPPPRVSPPQELRQASPAISPEAAAPAHDSGGTRTAPRGTRRARARRRAATGWPSCEPACARPARTSPRSSPAAQHRRRDVRGPGGGAAQADAGVAATSHLLDDLQRRIKQAHLENPAAVRGLLADCIADLLAPLERPLAIGEHVPTVIDGGRRQRRRQDHQRSAS